MYEDKTIDALHQEMLININDDYEKSPGNLPYDLSRSFAIEEAKLYTALSLLASMVDIDNLTGDDLTKYVLQRRGIIRKPSNKSNGVVTVTGNGPINIGDLFETVSGTQFKAIEDVAVTTSSNVNIEAVIAGSSGNVGANTITQMPITLTGITAVNNLLGTEDGYEEETDNSLRDRYYLEIRKPPTSGNIYHYMSWAKEVTGCGDAKVFPLWNGDNTVKVVIINSDKLPANLDLIDRVQAYIDPGISGNGSGEAPIGAYCTVVSATAKQITVSVELTKVINYTDADVVANITSKITKYLQDIAFEQDYVSYAKIGSLVLESEGVNDWSDLQLNSGTTNISVGSTEVATLLLVELI